MRNKKIISFNSLISFFLAISSIICMAFQASSHDLGSWAATYPSQNANNTYSFAIMDTGHIDGKYLYYYWENSTAKSLFETSLKNAFTQGWKSLIAGIEKSQEEAHIAIKYDAITSPTNAAASATFPNNPSYLHIRPGKNDAFLTYYAAASTYTDEDKLEISKHEIGHLWGIDDLYDYNKSLNSIYSQPYKLDSVTRHDLNALRIGLNNLWFDPGTGGVWRYQETPGVFRLRADVDFSGDITAQDSRLVLRYVSAMETFTTVQRKLSDVDENGSVTAADARLILKYASNEISLFPADE